MHATVDHVVLALFAPAPASHGRGPGRRAVNGRIAPCCTATTRGRCELTSLSTEDVSVLIVLSVLSVGECDDCPCHIFTCFSPGCCSSANWRVPRRRRYSSWRRSGDEEEEEDEEEDGDGDDDD